MVFLLIVSICFNFYVVSVLLSRESSTLGNESTLKRLINEKNKEIKELQKQIECAKKFLKSYDVEV